MQDGPFLILRIFMWAKYEVNDEIHLYFTGKNALTLALLLYRLYCLKVKEHPEERSIVTNHPEGVSIGVCQLGLENQECAETDEDRKPGKEKQSKLKKQCTCETYTIKLEDC